MVKRMEEMQGTDATKPTTTMYNSFIIAQVKAEQGCIVAPTLKTAEFEQGHSSLATQVAELESEKDKQGELLELYDAAGRPVDEEDAKLKLLNSLPPSYKPLVYSICDKSFQECWNALLQDQISREFEKSSVEAESQLLYSTQRQSKGGGSSRRSSGYTPEKIGAAGSKSNLYCRYCKKKGHLLESCFKLQKKRDSKPVAGVVVSAAADSQNKVLMASQIGGSDQDHSWVVDTGATDHMACKREYFHTYEPLHSPKFVYLGDNSVHPMVGIGSVVVKLSSGEKVTIEQVYHVPGLFKNLFSGKQFAKKKGTLVFTDTCKR
ncbi:hypothetical protein R1flu_013830 [Riccia fluitans]|uniref:Retrovirus-related Pol polyprotein from transposon TNT 1-94-like beta-barrel domain-containing protein n=1 Tax=Riccia fluitans TaxID=41844 RepID=A0ABD1YFH9_9MARC